MNNKFFSICLLVLLQTSFFTIEAANPSFLEKMISFPLEVSLDSDPEINENGVIQLSESRIELLQQKFKRNFAIRHTLSYGSFALYMTLSGIGLYQIGLLNFVFPAKIPSLEGFKDIGSEVAHLQQRVEQLEAAFALQPKATRVGWVWGGVKYFGSLVISAVAIAKIMQLKSYIEASPSFIWFFSKHSILDRIEILRRNVKAITDFNMPANYSLDYNTRAITPSLIKIAQNLEEFIAFTDYYFESIDQELLIKHGMDGQARYVFNISNDFFIKMHAALQNGHPATDTVAVIDDFKNDVSTCIKRCQFFGKDVLGEE